MSWRLFAACRGLDNDLFFLNAGALPDTLHNLILSTCQSCQVRQECLDYAMETRQPAGIWGGLTPRQRRLLRKKREAA